MTKSNQQLKREARAKYAEETKNYLVLGGQIIQGKYYRFKDAYTRAIKGKKITTASIREEYGREKINPRKVAA